MLSQLFEVELEIGGETANLSNSVTYQLGVLTVELFDIPVDIVVSNEYMIYVSDTFTPHIGA